MLRFYECDLTAWRPEFSNLVPLPIQEIDPTAHCGYVSSNRADLFKHLWDVHLRHKHDESLNHLKRRLAKSEIKSLDQVLLQLTKHYVLRHTSGTWAVEVTLNEIPRPRRQRRVPKADYALTPLESLFLD